MDDAHVEASGHVPNQEGSTLTRPNDCHFDHFCQGSTEPLVFGLCWYSYGDMNNFENNLFLALFGDKFKFPP